MKEYLVDTGHDSWGLELLEAHTLDEAKSIIKSEYANNGVVEIIAITYKKVNEKSYLINTDY